MGRRRTQGGCNWNNDEVMGELIPNITRNDQYRPFFGVTRLPGIRAQ